MTQAMRPEGPETLRDIMNELAGRPRPQTVPGAVVDLFFSPKPDDTIVSWSRDVVSGYRTTLHEERDTLPSHPDTTELMRSVAGERYDPDSVSVTFVADEVGEWVERRNNMIDRRIILATRRGLKSLSGMMLNRSVGALERVIEPIFAVVDRDAAAASERFDRSMSGE